MFNPKRFSFAVRLVLIFVGLIGANEVYHITFNAPRRAEDLPFFLTISVIGVFWIIYELAVHYGRIDVKPLEAKELKEPTEPKLLIKPSIEAPLHQKLWYYAKFSSYLIWSFLVGFFIGS
jgi:hypothetical protein